MPRRSINDEPKEREPEVVEDHRLAALERALDRHAELIKEQNRILGDWKMRLKAGLFQGLGTAVGATILFAILLWILGWLAAIGPLKPVVDTLTDRVNANQSSHPPQ